MPAFLAALLPLLSGSMSGLKNWFDFKQQSAKAEMDYKLALLQAQTEEAKQQAVSDSSDLTSRLNATTQQFKQDTFWFLCVPIIFTILFPARAVEMWNNFKLVPDFIQWLFLSVYSSIWGIPIVKGGYGAITNLLQQRQENKVQIAAHNHKIVFDTLKQIFPKGMNQPQVDVIDKALQQYDSISEQ